MSENQAMVSTKAISTLSLDDLAGRVQKREAQVGLQLINELRDGGGFTNDIVLRMQKRGQPLYAPELFAYTDRLQKLRIVSEKYKWKHSGRGSITGGGTYFELTPVIGQRFADKLLPSGRE